MEENKKRISLTTYIITLIIMITIIGVLLFINSQNKGNENTVVGTNTSGSELENNIKAKDELLSGETIVYKCERLDNLATPRYIMFQGNALYIYQMMEI